MSDRLARQADYWNRQAESFHRIYSRRKSWFLKQLDVVFRRDMYERLAFALEACEPVAGRTFLDVGCGTGVYCLELARRGAAHVTGIDIAGRMLQLCRDDAASQNLDAQCTFAVSDLLHFKTGARFDVTLGMGLFDYLAEPLPVLRRMRELTQDRLILSFPRLGTWRAPIRWMRLSLLRCEVHFYTKRRIERLLTEAGLDVRTLEQVGKLYCVVAAPRQA